MQVLPSSHLFAVQDTPHAGRAVFATTAIPADTLIWRSDDLSLSVLDREYRREVCAQCFAYEHGNHLKIRDQAIGFAFCRPECCEAWRAENGDIGVQTWTAVEKLVKGRGKEDGLVVDTTLPRPHVEEIQETWGSVEAAAALIRVARHGAAGTPIRVDSGTTTPSSDNEPGAEAVHMAVATKKHKIAMQKAIQQPISPDIMSFCVSGILWRYVKPEEWGTFLTLASDTKPYHNSDDLRGFARTYLHLLAILPLALLPLVTPETLFLLSARDSHNSFGIRSLEDEGSEFFGYGCWPAASYFNHSCGPNVARTRVGRTWEFRAEKDIEEGGELNITYLGGDEKSASREERNLRLKKTWGFECACQRCSFVV